MANLKPTKGEALLIERRRLRETQMGAAARYRVTPDKYRDWEADRRDDAPRPQKLRLQPFEICYLKRRRAGKMQKEVASQIGVTRLWLMKMEQGEAPADRLVEFWGATA